MKITLHRLPAALLLCVAQGAWAGVAESVHKVSDRLDDKAIFRAEAAALVASVPRATLLDELLELSDRPGRYATRAAAFDLLLAMEPFPFDELAGRFTDDMSSYQRGNLLWLLHFGAKQEHEQQRVVAQAKLELGNTAPGSRRYELPPEVDTGGAVMRVCDLAYRILVERLKLEGQLSHINPSADSMKERDNKLDRLQGLLGIHVPRSPYGGTAGGYKSMWAQVPWLGVVIGGLLALGVHLATKKWRRGQGVR